MLRIFRKFFVVRRRRKIRKTAKSKSDFALHKGLALTLAYKRIEHFNAIYGFTFNSVKIKNTTSRWGSCSSKGNLNFNYRMVFLPEKLSDYIIVHELCHLGEFNHSQKFWGLVSRTIPDYMEIRHELKHLRIKLE